MHDVFFKKKPVWVLSWTEWRLKWVKDGNCFQSRNSFRIKASHVCPQHAKSCCETWNDEIIMRSPTKYTGMIVNGVFIHGLCHMIRARSEKTEPYSYPNNYAYAFALLCSVVLNSSPPSAAYMRQWIGSALVHIMACRLFGVKPLSKPMLGYYQLDP